MSGHTKGPWKAYETEVYFANNAGGLSVAGCPDAEANARLIAAAPELLEAPEEMLVNYADCLPGESPKIDKARAAIDKAKGADQ